VLNELLSNIRGKRSYDRSCVHAAPARLRNQEFFSVLANRYFRTKAVKRRIRTDSDLDAFDLTTVVAGLANDLRKLTFMNAGRGRGLGDRDRRTDCQRQSNKCQLRPSRHLFLPFENLRKLGADPRQVRSHSVTLNAFAMMVCRRGP